MAIEPEGRARVGLILPSVNTVTEASYPRISPPGISFHSARMYIGELSARGLEEMECEASRAAKDLASAKVDCIAHCCTLGGVINGKDRELAFCREIEEATGIPTTSTLLAGLEALGIYAARRVVLTSPYPEELDALEKTFFEQNGFEVLSVAGLGLTDPHRMAQVRPHEVVELCRSAWKPGADAVFISCMQFDAMPAIAALEAEFGVPVISAHSATLWKIFQLLRIHEPLNGFGRLLADCVS